MKHESRLRVSYHISRLSAIWPLFRRLGVAGLLLAVLIGGYQWFQHSQTVGALEFSPHVVGIATDAVGVEGVTSGDMDNDGDLDVITAGLDGVKVYINDGQEKFESKIVDSVDGERVQVVDINADGNLDIFVTIPDGNPAARWYDNRGGIEFGKNDITITNGKQTKGYVGDINADGAPDIITATEEGGPIVLRRWMNTSGTFSATTLNVDSKVATITVADIDGNGYKDILTGGASGLQRWHTTDGLTWSRIDIDDSKPNRTHMVVADINGDDKADIITGDQVSNVIAIYTNQDNSAWQRTELADDADALTVAVRDLDEDGDEDIMVAAQDDNSVFWFKNSGEEEFTKETIATNLQSVFGLAVVDLDDDNDFDFVTADHYRGTIYWYERTIVKPQATAPTSIAQSADGTGRITFKTTLSDGDGDTTSIRVQYSKDGKLWYKPWLTKVTPSAGSVDLKNSLGFQVGTDNPIDTDTNSSVTLTLTWDTKSIENTGGPLVGDLSGIKLRIIPRDKRGTGVTAISNAFRVDNQTPQKVTNLQVTSIDSTSATLSWTKPTDSSELAYRIYFGTDSTAVTEQKSETWDTDNDEALDDTETTATTITGLENDKTYSFKLVARDAFGNEAASSTVRSTTSETGSSSSTPPSSGITPTSSPTSSPAFGEITPTPSSGAITPLPTASPFLTVVPTVTPSRAPVSVLDDNQPPFADAGIDQVINPSALVILDGSKSSDPDRDTITFSWKLISVPPGRSIELTSDHTATPSFSAGQENETYIVGLTVRDSRGATSFDTITIATQELPLTSTVPVEVAKGEVLKPVATKEENGLLALLRPLNILLAGLAVSSTGLLIAERLTQLITQRRLKSVLVPPPMERAQGQGRVVQYQTGEGIADVQVLVYDQQNKLRLTEKTNAKGFFPTFFPPGEYSLGIVAPGFTMAATAAVAVRAGADMVYTGGRVRVEDQNKPLSLLIPVKPTAEEVSTMNTRFLHWWQFIQRLGRVLSWPLFISGALLNTILVFLDPSFIHLAMEVLYIVLIIIKIAIEIRIRPAYGVVRDAITHVPIDLAVVRLLESKTNRLVMTRVTNSQGKFFALPPSGTYTVTITKQGYGTFSKSDITITDEHDATLQMTADLMPIVPHGGLQQVRAAVL